MRDLQAQDEQRIHLAEVLFYFMDFIGQGKTQKMIENSKKVVQGKAVRNSDPRPVADASTVHQQSRPQLLLVGRAHRRKGDTSAEDQDASPTNCISSRDVLDWR